MILHNSSFNIFFGNKQTAFNKEQFYTIKNSQELLEQAPFRQVKQAMNLDSLFVLNQVHSSDGFILSSHDHTAHLRPYEHDGDFLITNQPHQGLGIATADCLPIIFFDSHNQVIALAHAGWKGSVTGIALKTVKTMQECFGTDHKNLQIFFGPYGKICCYQVTEEFLDYFKNDSNKELFLQQRGKFLYFDVLTYNQLQLEKAGIQKEAFNSEYASCTICNPIYCSYRREGPQAQRQMTIVGLT
ncbi:MAG: peptidoglycan editing factor PgeF [Candidatus Babeliaceae bacterium]